MIKEKSCGSIIINNDKILLIKHNKGHWSFPKGHVEGNETEVETAIREVKEETNLDIHIYVNIKTIITYSPKEGVMKDVVYFLGASKNNNVVLQESEVCEYKWLSYEDAMEMITYDDDKDALKRIYMQ
jgi:8-oxo-dGTP pyrophosphatase MutT (NUDIX family)